MAYDKEPLDLDDLGKPNYSHFGIESNPFPTMGLPRDIPTTTADRREVIQRFKDVLRDCINGGGSSVTVLTGNYGSGKTHLLRYFKYAVNTQLLNSPTNKVMAVYVKSVTVEFADMFNYFADDIGKDVFTNIAINEINKYLHNLGEEKALSYIYDKELKKKKQQDIELEEYLNGSRYVDLFRDMRKNVFNKISSDDFVYALLHLAHPDHSESAWRWFLAENVDKNDRKIMLIDNIISEVKDVQEAFRSAIQLLLSFYDGLKALVILIDEFENITNIPKITRDRFVNDFRHFLDENKTGVCFVIASTFTSYQLVIQSESALSRRMAISYKLENFGEGDVQELIIRYLRLVRSHNANVETLVKKHRNTTEDIYPFTTDALKAIHEKTRGVVHSVIDVCREAIEIGVRNKSQLIDSKVIDSIKIA